MLYAGSYKRLHHGQTNSMRCHLQFKKVPETRSEPMTDERRAGVNLNSFLERHECAHS